MGDTKLLPCPCCEYDAAFRHEHNRDCSQTWIECSGCGLQSARYHWLGNDDGIRKTLAGVWNHRPALLARQEGEEGSLRFIAKRNLRRMIEIGSTDTKTMLLCLEELS